MRDDDALFENADPFYAWRTITEHLEWAERVQEPGRVPAGMDCDEYRFTAMWQNSQGLTTTQEATICIVAETGVPIYFENMARYERGTLSFAWSLDNPDDPANVVEIPGFRIPNLTI